MSCTATTVITESYEEPVLGSSSSSKSSYGTFGSIPEMTEKKRKRRHSSYQPRPYTAEQDNIQVLVDRFIAELGRRLDFLESYGHLKVDAGIERAYSTLQAVHQSCSHVSDSVLDAGRRKASVMVHTLEGTYKDALAAKQTFEAKVQEGIKLMESLLVEFESRAYAMRDSALEPLLGKRWPKRVDGGMEKAHVVLNDGLDEARHAKDTLKANLQATIDRAVEKARTQLIRFEDLPEPWKNNPYIHNGYRFHLRHIDCIKSTFGAHNETINIWSHLLGFLFILALALYVYPTTPIFTHSSVADVLVASAFFIAAAKCLLCSSIWHTFNCIAHNDSYDIFACVDYTGISLLVGATIMTTEYAAFYCEPVSRWIYLSTTMILGIAGSILPWHPTFNRNDMAWARVMFYMALACTGFLPVFQLASTRGWDWVMYFYSPVLKSIGIYTVGAVLYAGKMPERWFPGCFDYCGASHNIWHFAVVIGIFFHYVAMQELFGMAFERAEHGCSAY